MNARQHTLLARALIDACGGVDACRKPVTRVEQSQLYAYRDFNSGVFMPADIIDRLESLCGNPVYSQFLFDAHQGASEIDSVVAEGNQLGWAGIDLQRLIHEAAADGDLSPNEKVAIQSALNALADRAKRLGAGLDVSSVAAT